MLAAADRLLATSPTEHPRVLSLSQQLRAGTSRDHAAAEASLDVTSLRHTGDLAQLLRGWRSVWRDVGHAASALRASAPARAELLPMARQAERWLRADLQSLGHDAGRQDERDADGGTAPDPELCALLADPVSSWGVAYVLRGSRLGGTVLAPQVRTALGLSDAAGTAFLASTGTKPGREWVAFRQRLDDVALAEDQLIDVVNAARWTFRWVAAVAADHAGQKPAAHALLTFNPVPRSRQP